MNNLSTGYKSKFIRYQFLKKCNKKKRLQGHVEIMTIKQEKKIQHPQLMAKLQDIEFNIHWFI